ncbi:hypothetical protein CGRA01v4_00775 [Colletotrichum graminicola]|nr:hypothetical protein CGRA01v4_00775 [Colletotrichum graminicola]
MQQSAMRMGFNDNEGVALLSLPFPPRASKLQGDCNSADDEGESEGRGRRVDGGEVRDQRRRTGPSIRQAPRPPVFSHLALSHQAQFLFISRPRFLLGGKQPGL